MDFFQHQDDARRRTGWLVALFVLAVIVIIAMVYIVVAIFVAWAQLQNGGPSVAVAPTLWDPRLLLGVGVGVIAVVGGGSLYKIAQLAGGGEVVAASLGGRLVSPDTSDPDERRLLNVVEEMAIASGTPVPPVFVMDREAGINAFAAGYTTGDAVIGVTRGSIEQLSRDELQGVIAHEFSHILSGDMRLNVRLIGVIHGILIIGLIGYTVMRAAGYGAMSRSRSSRDRGNPLPLIALGLSLVIIGYAGTFFGRAIKAAVSRQREYLADAAAVQFTRHPAGLAGALKKIGGYSFGTRLVAPNVEQASHMLFGQGLRLSSLLATHPPLPKRIQRIDPSWDGQFPKVSPSQRVQEKIERKHARLEGRAIGAAPLAASSLAERIAAARSDASALEQIGNPAPEHATYAAALIRGIPDLLRDAAHTPHGARAVVYALLLDRDDAVRRRQMEHLAGVAEPAVYELVARLLEHLGALKAEARLPLLDMAMPLLTRISPAQYELFKDNLRTLIEADDRVDLFEWTLRRVLLRHLEPHFSRVPSPRIRYRRLLPLKAPLATLLSALAYVGHSEAASAREAFAAGVRMTGLLDLPMVPRERCGLRAVDAALDVFAEATPGIKKKLLQACAVCIETDHTVTVREAELLRAVADSLDCPMPPVLPGQRLA